MKNIKDIFLGRKKSEVKETVFDVCAERFAVEKILNSMKPHNDKMRLLSVYIKDIEKKFNETAQILGTTDKKKILDNTLGEWLFLSSNKCTKFLDEMGVSKKDRKQYVMELFNNKISDKLIKDQNTEREERNKLMKPYISGLKRGSSDSSINKSPSISDLKKSSSVKITKSPSISSLKKSSSVKGHKKDVSGAPTLGNRDSVASRKNSSKK